MIISKKTMLSTAVRAALVGAIALPMVGCDETETYNQQQYVEAQENFVQQQRQQVVGNVQGVVLDSNGNPLAGAEVSIGTQTTTTDNLGYYAFADVAAVNVVMEDLAQSPGGQALQAVPLVISVKAEGHLGGRTQAYPVAISDTEQYIYLDGFTAQAENLYLPELNATVKATLRSTVTGEAIANKEVTLEFVSVDEGLEDNNNPGGGEFEDIASTYFTATTDANGAFVAGNLPANSLFHVLVEGYHVDGNYVRDEIDDTDDVEFTTAEEAIVSNWGEIFVTEEIVADKIAPFVRNIQSASNTGRLEKGEDGTTATGGLVFEFSETISLAHLDGSTIKVLVIQEDGSGVYDTTFTHNITVNQNVTSVRLNLTQAIKPGQQVDVYFERADFLDISDSKNKLAVEMYNKVNDTYKSGINPDDYVQYTLYGYEQADQVVGNPVIEQITVDSEEFVELSTHNSAFVDVENATGAIEQLNSVGSHTKTLLSDLANELTTKAGISIPTAVHIDVAKVIVTFPEGTDAGDIYVADSFGQTTGAIITPDLDTDDVDFDNPVEFLIVGVAPGQTVKVRARDSFGAATSYVDVELQEKVAPTTVIQNSYRVDGDKVTGTAGEGSEIDGGHDVTIGKDGSLGYPYLTIAPGILDLESLTAKDGDDDTYDAGAFTTWNGAELTTAVAFSESIAWIGSDHTPVLDDVNGVDLNSFDIVNDITATGGDNGNSAARDFVTFDIDNIFTFADSDGGTISFDSIIEDLNDNTASAATVVVRDALPPLITKAVIEERGSRNYLNITFSENLATKPAYIDGVDGEDPYILRIANNGVNYEVSVEDVSINGNTIDIEDVDMGQAFTHLTKIEKLQVNVADTHGNNGTSQGLDYNYDNLYFKVDNDIDPPVVP